MIAKNLLKFPEAMALQLPLPFKRLRLLCQSRPTTRAGRAIRAARAGLRRAMLAVKVIYPVAKAKAPGKKLMDNRAAQMPLQWTAPAEPTTGEWWENGKAPRHWLGSLEGFANFGHCKSWIDFNDMLPASYNQGYTSGELQAEEADWSHLHNQ